MNEIEVAFLENSAEKWFSYATERKDAKTNLFCFPHAGAGPGVYALWGRIFSSDLSFYPVHYPLRERRKMESLPDSIQELAYSLARDNKKLFVDKPFALYGHCMGAIIAYEVAKAVEELYGVEPVLTIASSSAPPNCTLEQQIDNTMDIKQLAKFFADMHYIDAALIGDEMYVKYFIPVLKADYLLQQKYTNARFKRLDSPILVLYGENDTQLEMEKLVKWESFTSESVSYEAISGGHFFINKDNMSDIIQMLEKRILKRNGGYGNQNE